MKNKFSIALSLAVIVAMLVTSLALADDLYNLLDNDIDNSKELVTITAGGSVTVGFKIRSTSSGSDVANCNVDNANKATLTVTPPTGVTVSAPVEFSACEQEKEITFSSTTPDTYEINSSDFSLSGGKDGSKWSTTTAQFQLKVNPATASDITPPTVTLTPNRVADSNGWYNHAVTFTVTANEPATCDAPIDYSGPDSSSATVTGHCTDTAGNSGTGSITFKYDATAPGITFIGPSTSAWYNANVTANWSCSDVTSGPVSNPVSAVANGEGNAVAATGTCVDNAGNSVSDTQYFMIDKTAPVVAVTGVANGAQYTLGAVPTAGCSTTDGLSGVATSASLSTSGGPVGFITATCSGAFDNAGNAGNSATATYQVVYAWDGFFQPVDNLMLNGAKAGQAIPLKWRLTDANGMPVLNLTSVNVKVGVFACASGTPTDAIEEYATGSSGLQNLGDGNYQFNWKTLSTYANSCRSMTLDLGDGVLHTVQFQFKK